MEFHHKNFNSTIYFCNSSQSLTHMAQIKLNTFFEKTPMNTSMKHNWMEKDFDRTTDSSKHRFFFEKYQWNLKWSRWEFFFSQRTLGPHRYWSDFMKYENKLFCEWNMLTEHRHNFKNRFSVRIESVLCTIKVHEIYWKSLYVGRWKSLISTSKVVRTR